MPNTAAPAKESYCAKMAGKQACQHPQKKQDDCGKQSCAMMFSCSICGFVVPRAVALKPVLAFLLPKPVAPNTDGDIAAYHADNWKPPQAC